MVRNNKSLTISIFETVSYKIDQLYTYKNYPSKMDSFLKKDLLITDYSRNFLFHWHKPGLSVFLFVPCPQHLP